MNTFSTSIYAHSYSSDMPNILHPKVSNFPLNFGTPPQQIQRGNASQPSETVVYSYIVQPQTVYRFQTTNISLHDWQQIASLPQERQSGSSSRVPSAGRIGPLTCSFSQKYLTWSATTRGCNHEASSGSRFQVMVAGH